MTKKPKASVVLPTYREAENIGQLIVELEACLREPKEIIVVDDSSPDSTADIVRKLQKKYDNIRLVVRKERGIASAIYRGIRESSKDARIVVWMDCDLGMPPSFVPTMVERVEQDSCDICIGSRYAKGGADKRPFIRCVTSKIFNIYAQLLLGLSVKDVDSGFIALKKSVFDKVKFPAYGYGEYFVELVYTAKKAGFRIIELGYVFTDRTRGVSKTADNIFTLLKYGIQYGIKVLRLRFS